MFSYKSIINFFILFLDFYSSLLKTIVNLVLTSIKTISKTQFLSLFIIFSSITFTSCQKKAINSNEIEKPMQQVKLTENDLNNQKPIIITTNKGKEEAYSVIIYTDNAKPLRDKGILVQSESKNFVTALIRKEDLKIINNLSTIKSIEFPIMDHPTKN